MTEYKKVFHTTKLGVKSIIQSEGWVVNSNSPHCAFYGRGIYFWELECDAHYLGQLWYGKEYEIVYETLPFYENYTIIDRDIPPVKDPDCFSRYFLSQDINILVIPKAYFNHKTKIEAVGCSYVWLIDLPFTGIAKIKLNSKDVSDEKSNNLGVK
jgi:hypothetical protein